MIFILVLCPATAALRVKFEKDCVGPRIVRAGANSVHAFHVASVVCRRTLFPLLDGCCGNRGGMEGGKDEELDALAARADHNYRPSLLGSAARPPLT